MVDVSEALPTRVYKSLARPAVRQKVQLSGFGTTIERGKKESDTPPLTSLPPKTTTERSPEVARLRMAAAENLCGGGR